MDSLARAIAARIALNSAKLDRLTHWLFVASVVVIIALIWEDWSKFKELIALIRQYLSDRSFPLYRSDLNQLTRRRRRAILRELVPALIIVGGIAGELVIQFVSSETETDLRSAATVQAGILNKEAADAIREAAELFRIIFPREAPETPESDRLKHFNGTRLMIQTGRVVVDSESNDIRGFASSFWWLRKKGWMDSINIRDRNWRTPERSVVALRHAAPEEREDG